MKRRKHCEFCGGKIGGHGNRRFCSRVCQSRKSQGLDPYRECIFCGKEFSIVGGKASAFCSDACRKERKLSKARDWYNSKKYDQSFRDHIRKLDKESRDRRKDTKAFKDRQREKRRRLLRDPGYRMTRNLRNRLRRFIQGNGSKSVMRWLGCSRDEFVEHIESQFSGRMSWENYGRVWHIDHIVPCAKFSLEKEEHRKICFHYSNMRPLSAKRNMRENSRYLEDQQMPLCL